MSCDPNCLTRQAFEAENLPGPSPQEVCEAAAAAIVGQEISLGACPLDQIEID